MRVVENAPQIRSFRVASAMIRSPVPSRTFASCGSLENFCHTTSRATCNVRVCVANNSVTPHTPSKQQNKTGFRHHHSNRLDSDAIMMMCSQLQLALDHFACCSTCARLLRALRRDALRCVALLYHVAAALTWHTIACHSSSSHGYISRPFAFALRGLLALAME